MHRLRRGGRSADKIGIGLALGHVLGGSEAQDRHLFAGDVAADREQLEGGERAEDQIDIVALDQLLRLGLGAGRVTAGVADHQLDLAARHFVVSVLQKQDRALLHLNPDRSKGAGLDREEPDFDRSLLGDRRQRQARRNSRPGRAHDEAASREQCWHGEILLAAGAAPAQLFSDG
jgi:hypothetical protein